MHLQPEQFLNPDGQKRLVAIILDWVTLPGRRFEMGWCQPVQIPCHLIRNEQPQTFRKFSRIDAVYTGHALLQGNEPVIKPRQQSVVADIGPGITDRPMEKAHPLAKLQPVLRKGQGIYTDLSDTIGQSRNCLFAAWPGQRLFVE